MLLQLLLLLPWRWWSVGSQGEGQGKARSAFVAASNGLSIIGRGRICQSRIGTLAWARFCRASRAQIVQEGTRILCGACARHSCVALAARRLPWGLAAIGNEMAVADAMIPPPPTRPVSFLHAILI